ncbi:Histone H1/H5 [Corchorus capsularis]|uniref:Histone H1/H5 n=1 Tax=Corchorus capsularis TaxID=210143 RepID=A0A1R3I1K9_COCAP|nr:Histone H1/H5 [Corchorus capsularis]
MIVEAIGALKDSNGSSKRAIAKYIESTHKDLPPTHSALLTHHLKRLKNNGLLVMVKKSYKLASTARSEGFIPDSAPVPVLSNPNPPDASPGPKRGRGRPPKPKPISQPTLQTVDPNPTQQPVTVTVPLAGGPRKSPGRPRKNNAPAVPVPGPVPVQVQLGVRRGRGRPPKTGLKKSPGRPRKPKTVRSVVAANSVKRGRGRPPKAMNQLPPQSVLPIQGQPVAVPYADAAATTTTVTGVVQNLGRPRGRGRPKGVTSAAVAAAAVVPGKRRGRPPKLGGVSAAKPLTPRKTTGKPVGRPKKNTEGAESKASAAAYGDLKRKLEFFQSRVKQAVGVLKPQFTSESNISAIGAIQELEGLAAMDISNSTFKDDAQPMAMPPPASSNQPPFAQIEGQSLDRILLEGTNVQEVIRAMVLDIQARLLLDMLGNRIESTLVNPSALVSEMAGICERLSSVDPEIMAVDPALVQSIQAYVYAVLDKQGGGAMQVFVAHWQVMLSLLVLAWQQPQYGSKSYPKFSSSSNKPGSLIQAWVQCTTATAMISSSTDGVSNSTPNPIGPSSFMPISINMGTFPGTPAVRLIGEGHLLHRLCQLLLFCFFFQQAQPPLFAQRTSDANPQKPEPGAPGKMEEVNSVSVKPTTTMTRADEAQGSRAGQMKDLFLILMDLCRRTAGLAHLLPVSQIGSSSIQVRLHYIDGNYTVLPEVVEASIGPQMQNCIPHLKNGIDGICLAVYPWSDSLDMSYYLENILEPKPCGEGSVSCLKEMQHLKI